MTTRLQELSRIGRFAVLSFLLVFARVVSAQNTHISTDVQVEEYRVYEAVISEMFSGEEKTDEGRSNPTIYVISKTTVGNFTFGGTGEDWKSLTNQLTKLSNDTAKNYAARSRVKGTLTNSFNLKTKYVLFSEEEHKKIFKNGPAGWPAFYKAFPGSDGLLGFSRVGFSKDGNQALVYVSHGCGGLCGTGHYVLLAKSQKGWAVSSKFMAWIS